ncbi:MAG: GIY-YIG nuclease family protein [candidate division NC10 bacterium]|nr:GIY-YIG nuclease family protein [candidate division NC10 bacterium]
MACTIYILRNRSGKHYVGMSEGVPRRLREHNAGGVRSTKSGRPWAILYEERVASREEARVRERYWKSGGGRRSLGKTHPKFPRQLKAAGPDTPSGG